MEAVGPTLIERLEHAKSPPALAPLLDEACRTLKVVREALGAAGDQILCDIIDQGVKEDA